MQKFCWTQCEPNPLKKCYQCCVVSHYHNVYIYGGRTEYGNVFNHFYSFNTKTQVWTQLNNNNAPPCYLTGAVVWCDTIYFFGGFDADDRTSNTLFCCDLSNFTWKIIEPRPGRLPPRGRHSCVLHENVMLIFGGVTELDNNTNTLFEYNLMNNTWRIVHTKGAIPSKRNDHGALVWKNFMFIFGGFDGNHTNDLYEYDIYRCFWRKITLNSSWYPEKRWGHTVFEHDNFLYCCFGGGDYDHHQRDLFRIHLKELKQWEKLDVQQVKERWYARGCLVENSFFVFGGQFYEGTFSNELLRLELPTKEYDHIFKILKRMAFIDCEIIIK